MAKKFQRKIEDFTCEKCKEKNIGTGYTNHCKKCLWSKHVDINPGDRAEKCCGMMEPVEIDFKNGEFVIIHKCIKCRFEKRNTFNKDDNFSTAISIVRNNLN